MGEIDLTPFCGAAGDHHKHNLTRPFTRGEFTYATNGKVALRVPKRDGVPEAEGPKIEEIFAKVQTDVTPVAFAPLPPLPETTEEECDQCDASGKAHDCPNCDCKCNECDGSGMVKKTERVVVRLRGSHYDLKYIHLLAQLPTLAAPAIAPLFEAMYFTFDGGDGVLMPMNWSQRVPDVEQKAAPTPTPPEERG